MRASVFFGNLFLLVLLLIRMSGKLSFTISYYASDSSYLNFLAHVYYAFTTNYGKKKHGTGCELTL